MTKINTFLCIIFLGLSLNACGTSQTPAGTSQASVLPSELTGSYDCFAIDGMNTSDLGSLTLNADQSGSFGSNPIQWTYDPVTNTLHFTGDAALRDASYLMDGQSLSVNEDSEDHFTCVKSVSS